MLTHKLAKQSALLFLIACCGAFVQVEGRPQYRKQPLKPSSPRSQQDAQEDVGKIGSGPFDPLIKNMHSLAIDVEMNTDGGEDDSEAYQAQDDMFDVEFECIGKNCESAPRAHDVTAEFGNLADVKNPEPTFLDSACLQHLTSELSIAPEPGIKELQQVDGDALMKRTSNFVCDTFMAGERPLYLGDDSVGASNVQNSLEGLFSLWRTDKRPLLTTISVRTGIGGAFAISWVVESVNGKLRVYQASPVGAFGISEWLVRSETTPSSSAAVAKAKENFGLGQMLDNGRLVAYRNNLRAFLQGICSLRSPSKDFFYASATLFGTTVDMVRNDDCKLTYNVYEYDPSSCMRREGMLKSSGYIPENGDGSQVSL